jgi:septal ring factor EnvC (AmiA/AmiB activator)
MKMTPSQILGRCILTVTISCALPSCGDSGNLRLELKKTRADLAEVQAELQEANREVSTNTQNVTAVGTDLAQLKKKSSGALSKQETLSNRQSYLDLVLSDIERQTQAMETEHTKYKATYLKN